MGALVILRDLIKSPARGQTIDLNVLFPHLNFDSLFGCVLAGATSPFSPEAVARAFRFLGALSSSARADSETELSEFTRRYSERLLATLRIDVRPAACEQFHREMGKVYTLSRNLAKSGAPRRPCLSAGHAGWGGLVRYVNPDHDTRQQNNANTAPEPKPPRMTMALSTARSSVSGPDGHSRRLRSLPSRRASPYAA